MRKFSETFATILRCDIKLRSNIEIKSFRISEIIGEILGKIVNWEIIAKKKFD